jgi:type I restriction enzyme M protein
VRVARLIAVASGGDPARIARADALRRDAAPFVRDSDVIATNPPFAGDAAYEGFEVSRLGRAERDALFLERCLDLLRPGGRLAIVLPHNKVAARSWGALRRWLVERARVFAVVSLARETFLPHTSQKAVVLFAKRRERVVPFARVDRAEPVFFAVSERAGKDAAGEPILRPGRDRTWRAIDHDLDAIAPKLVDHFAREGFAA